MSDLRKLLRRRMARGMMILTAAALAVAGCSNRADDSDSLTVARRNLQPAPCGPAPAVAGVAGVNENPRAVYLGDWVVVAVCQLDGLLKAAEAQQQPLTLFIEGLDFGNPPTGIDLDSGILTFVLDREEENEELWQPLLYGPLFDPTASMRVSVGVRGGRPLPRAAGANLTLVLDKVYTDWMVWLWLAFLAAIVAALLLFGRKSDLLRDGPPVGGVRQSYSLGRAQMAWWFLLILVGYVFIWLVTEDRYTVPPSLLALMGISAATALASVALRERGTGRGARRALLENELAALDEALLKVAAGLDEAARRAVEPAAGASETAAALRSALEKKRAELEAARAAVVVELAGLTTVVPSKGFWNDLVTDDRGAVSLDRFQIVAWSLVLGGVFLSTVLWHLRMPEFNATLLALMGISSGTYIGFKLPSKPEG